MSVGAFDAVQLLGEENIENLKKRICNLILERVKADLDDYGRYLLYPPDMDDMISDTYQMVRKKIEKMYKDAVIDVNKDYIEKMKAYMAGQFGGDKTLRREAIDLAKKYYWRGNERSKERKFAEELLEVLRLTQEEIIEEMGEAPETTEELEIAKEDDWSKKEIVFLD